MKLATPPLAATLYGAGTKGAAFASGMATKPANSLQSPK